MVVKSTLRRRRRKALRLGKNFVKLTTSSSAKDHSKVSDFDYLKEGMKELSNKLLNSGEEGVKVKDLKSPANEPAKVNAFMKQTNNVPLIFCPDTKSYRFHDVFVERAARKW